MILGGTESSKTNVIHYLKSTFKFGSEKIETFTYIGLELTQNSDYNIRIEQNKYIASTSEILLPKEIMSDRNSLLTEA